MRRSSSSLLSSNSFTTGNESVTCSKNLSYCPKWNEEKKIDRIGNKTDHVPKNRLQCVGVLLIPLPLSPLCHLSLLLSRLHNVVFRDGRLKGLLFDLSSSTLSSMICHGSQHPSRNQ